MEIPTTVEVGEASMRGMIHTLGLTKALATAADMFAAPGNDEEREFYGGMLTAIYKAGQLSGVMM